MALTHTLTELGGAESGGGDTLTGRAIGTAGADRWVVLSFTCNALAPSSVTIGGVAATMIIDASLGAAIGWAWALVPTGTTATIVVNGSSGWAVQAIWAIYGTSLIDRTDNVWDLDFANSTFSINVTAGGVALGVAIDGGGATVTIDWTAGLTNEGAARATSAIWGRSGGADTASTTSLSCSHSGAVGLPAAWAISFRPIEATGTMTATEGADSAAMTGTVTNNAKARPHFRRPTRFYPRKEAA